MSDDGLRIRHLAASYGAVRVLEDVSLDVPAGGAVVGLVGANGAGKTTLLRAISGVGPKRVADEATMAGRPLPARPHRVAQAGIAHVPEGRGLLPSLSVEENLRFARYAVGLPSTPESTARTLEAFPTLRRLLHVRAGSLSGGEQQMVAIARGITTAPKILMVDELSLGLSPKATVDCLGALLRACATERISLLLVDQNVRQIARVCERVLVLNRGRSHLIETSDAEMEEAIRTVYFARSPIQ